MRDSASDEEAAVGSTGYDTLMVVGSRTSRKVVRLECVRRDS